MERLQVALELRAQLLEARVARDGRRRRLGALLRIHGNGRGGRGGSRVHGDALPGLGGRHRQRGAAGLTTNTARGKRQNRCTLKEYAGDMLVNSLGNIEKLTAEMNTIKLNAKI